MNLTHLYRTILTLLTVAASLHAAPLSRQQVGTLEQVPEGLAKSDWASILEAYEAGRHAFQPAAGGWEARNPGQQWRTTFDRRGFVAQPEGGSWQWGLELRSYGIDGAEGAISGVPEVQAEGQRLAYQWNPSLTEWFINDRRGLEHGFIVAERPQGGEAQSPLAFTLGVRGGLRPAIAADALGVAFQDAGGVTVLTYTGLKVWDADGRVLASRFVAAGDDVRLLVEADGARYPITIDPVAQQAYLKASNTGADDRFGSSVAVSGDTVVIGAYFEDSNATGVNGNQADNTAINSGAAYIFVRSGTIWKQQAYLKQSNTGAGDYFGYTVAVSGDTVVVGATSEDSNATGVNGDQNNNLSIDSGAVYVFVRSGSTWTQQAYLKASNAGASDLFGASLAMSGDTVVVGASFEYSNATGVNGVQNNESARFAGAAYVFVRSGATWTQQAYLKASNTEAFDQFGRAVAVSGDTIVVASPFESSSATGVNGNQADNTAPACGAAYVFARSGTTWTQQAYLKASNAGANDVFATSISVSGDTLVVGANGEDSNATGVNGNQADNTASASGAAYVFVRSGTTWTQQAYLKASNTGPGDSFGASVSVSGDTLLIGANLEDSTAAGVNGNQADDTATDSGAAYLFVRNGSAWVQEAYLKASNTGANDGFGASVAIANETFVIGAAAEDSIATGIGGNQADDSAASSGAAYVSTRYASGPNIAVTQAGNGITDGTGGVDFGFNTEASFPALTFTITNFGDQDLTGLSVTKDGADAADFTIGALSDTSIPVGSGSVTFTITFAPTTAGSKSVFIRIASNMNGLKNPFDYTVTGRRLLISEDTDADGLNDAAEFDLAALGFNWQTSQPTLVNTLFANTTAAGLYNQTQYDANFATGRTAGRNDVTSSPNTYSLYTQTEYAANYTTGQNAVLNSPVTYGLYTAAQVQDLNIGVPLLSRNPTTGKFILTIGVQRSPNLATAPFADFLFDAPGAATRINAAGKLEFEFPASGSAEFFRLRSQ